MAGSKPLPKKLADALANQPKYKERQRSADEQLDALLGLPTGSSTEKDYSFERGLLEEALGGGRGARTAASLPTSARARHEPGDGGADGAVLATMAKRLTHLERTTIDMKRQIEDKDASIAELQGRNDRLEQVAAEGTNEIVKELEYVRGENQELRAQVHEMETFLADYGLIWIGSQQQSAPQGVQDETKTERRSSPALPHGPPVSLDEFKKKVDALNALLESTGPQVKIDGKKAKFEDQDRVVITIFGDGLMVMNGIPRLFGEASTQAFVKDIMDGFFPQEFKQKYPDGVLLGTNDRRQMFIDDANRPSDGAGPEGTFSAFSGAGQQLGHRARELSDIGASELLLNATRSDELLRRLPEKVIRNGRVVHIRTAVEARLNGSSADSGSCTVDVVHTPALQQLQEKAQHPPESLAREGGDIGTPVSASCASKSDPMTSAHGRIATLRVRLDGGQRPLILKMGFDDSVHDLQCAVAKHLKIKDDAFELRTTYPNRAYDAFDRTLEDVGLVPNVTLILRRL